MDESLSGVVRTIVLPAYNEEGFIAEMIRLSLQAGEKSNDAFEVIVIDNASTDNTAKIVTDIGAQDERVRLVSHPENRLYAGSCRSGIEAARGERVFILDSDGQHSPDDIWKFDARLLEGFDLVFGRRTQRAEPFTRIAMSRFLWLLARLYIGFNLHDVNCGIRGMNRNYITGLEIKHRVNLVNPELFVRAKQRNMNISEVDVIQESRKAGVSSHQFNKLVDIFKDVTSYLWALRKDVRTSAKA